MKYLRDILFEVRILHQTGSTDILIHSLQYDSRAVMQGSLFFALKGTATDGHEFIKQAIVNGAIAVVCEKLPSVPNRKVTYLQVEDCAETMGTIASNYYGSPSARLNLVGVTGTNGKTTTVTLLYEMFRKMGKKAGLISTITNKINDRLVPSTHTTPDTIQLNQLMAKMVEEGCTHCFMEVSSHAVDQKRISGLTFHGGIFTNITHDHLDYHKTFDAYIKAKKGFFDALPSDAFALVNKDDRNGMVMVQNTLAKKFTYSIQTMADFRCRIVENRFEGLLLNIGGVDCTFRLIGKFNAYNILVVYTTAELLGADRHRILEILTDLKPVDGRFNAITSNDNITAIVDYAHTPDALQNVLETINAIRTHKEKLITVVGAGGNRDRAKRPVMAHIACKFSDRVILTSDNPRYEKPEDILEEMKKGVEAPYSRKTTVIVNREEAIRSAVMMAGSGDIILVAGKGHEKYQEIEGVKHPFDDRKVLEELLATHD